MFDNIIGVFGKGTLHTKRKEYICPIDDFSTVNVICRTEELQLIAEYIFELTKTRDSTPYLIDIRHNQTPLTIEDLREHAAELNAEPYSNSRGNYIDKKTKGVCIIVVDNEDMLWNRAVLESIHTIFITSNYLNHSMVVVSKDILRCPEIKDYIESVIEV